jgi:hypothetical protein
MPLIDRIRQKLESDRFEFSRHAVDQSIRRHVSVREIREVISSGEIIEEYPEDKYWPSNLIYGRTNEGRPLPVQCSHPSRKLVKIVTLYDRNPLRTRPGPVDRLQGKETDLRLRQEVKLVERRVTYALELDGKFYIVENVPARVDEETGEQYFSPTTLERLQQIILASTEPSRMVETPVYEYLE